MRNPFCCTLFRLSEDEQRKAVMEEYRYKVSDFEGPLDLLLYLIEKNKVDIYNIPIAEIADQFNEYVAQIEAFDVNYGSKFFLMAATLLQIKSRHLLPKVKAVEAEEEDDPEEELVRQLLEYKRMKEASSVMAGLWEKRQLMHSRERTPFAYEPKFSGTIEKNALFHAFRLVCRALTEKEPPPVRIEREIYSVDECMDTVLDFLRQSAKPRTVMAVFTRCRTRLELVVTFLAVLELLRTGRCRTLADGEEGNTLALQYIN